MLKALPTLTPTLIPRMAHLLANVKGLIFDMDGTLTMPLLDFVEMRRRLNITVEQDILATARALAEPERTVAFDIIEQMEREAAENTRLQPTLSQLFQFLHATDLKRFG